LEWPPALGTQQEKERVRARKEKKKKKLMVPAKILLGKKPAKESKKKRNERTRKEQGD